VLPPGAAPRPQAIAFPRPFFRSTFPLGSQSESLPYKVLQVRLPSGKTTQPFRWAEGLSGRSNLEAKDVRAPSLTGAIG